MKNKPISIEFRNISIPKATIDKILKIKRPKDALALYLFYYYTAIWQKTSKPHCTTQYASKGLECDKSIIQKNKKRLIELGLIEDVRIVNKHGRVEGYYIHVLYYEGNQPLVKPATGKTAINAYSTNNKTAAAEKRGGQRCVKKSLKLQKQHNTKDSPEHRLSLKLFKILKPIVPARNEGMPKIKDNKRDWTSWHKSFCDLLTDGNNPRSEKHIASVIKFYGEHIRERLTPKLYSANTFCKEFHRIEMLMEIQQQDKQQTLTQRLWAAYKTAQSEQICKWTDEQGRRFVMYPDGNWKQLGKNAQLAGNIVEDH